MGYVKPTVIDLGVLDEIVVIYPVPAGTKDQWDTSPIDREHLSDVAPTLQTGSLDPLSGDPPRS